MDEKWADNKGVRIHYLVSGSAGTPLLYVPGQLGVAELFEVDAMRLSPRRVVSLSLRGRGKSDYPEDGYTFADHLGDIQAVAEAEGLQRFGLIGYSVGAAYAVGFALQNPDRVAGLLLLDYPPVYLKTPPDFVERVSKIFPDYPQHVLESIGQDSSEIAMWDELSKLKSPLWAVKGGREGSMLTSQHCAELRRVRPDIRIVTIEEAAHDLWEPDPQPYETALAEFALACD